MALRNSEVRATRWAYGLLLVVFAAACGRTATQDRADPVARGDQVSAPRDSETPEPNQSPPGHRSTGGETRAVERPPDPALGPVLPKRPPLTEAWLGVQLANEPTRAEVSVVLSGSPAERSGLESGDIITSIDDTQVTEPETVVERVRQSQPGDPIRVRWTRGGRELSGSVALAASPHPEDAVRFLLVHRKAPEIAGVVAFQGEIASLGDAHGRVLVLEFWASYCPPCRNVGEIVQGWFDELRPLGLTALGVTSDSALRGSEVARARNMSYPLASDSRAEVARAYAAREIPMVVLIDQRGYVRDVVLGYEPTRLAEMRRQIDQLLGLSP
jgi:peroxiredoxin